MSDRPNESESKLSDADLLHAQSHILTAIAAERPLSETLTLIAQVKDNLFRSERCAICLIDADGVTLLDGASPSLPPELSARLHHLRLADSIGSRRSVDPRTHPAWAPYRAEVERYGLRLIRSDPLVTAVGEVAGYLFALGTDAAGTITERTQRWLPVFADLTLVALRHAQVDADLQLSERRLSTLIDHSPALIALKDPQGRYLIVNRAMQDLFGLRREDIIGSDASLFGDDVADRVAQLQRETMDSGTPVETEMEVAGHRLRVIYFPVTTPRGTPYVVGVIGIDITNEKRNEERLYQAARMESAGRLAAEIAHDFNNILNGIAISAAAAEDARADVSGLRSALENIGSFVARASKLTQRLVSLGRPGSFKLEVVDVNHLIGSLSPLLEATARARARVEIDLESRIPSIKVDPTELERALVNLVANAHDAVGEDGRIVVRTRLVETGAPEVDVSVQDDGDGIDPAIVERVFEPFFTTKVDRGSGLGLAMVQATALRAGGRVSIDSQPGVGTTVHLHLPVGD